MTGERGGGRLKCDGDRPDDADDALRGRSAGTGSGGGR